MKKYFCGLIIVLFCAFAPLIHAQNLPAGIAKGVAKSTAKNTASQITLQTLEKQVATQVTQQALRETALKSLNASSVNPLTPQASSPSAAVAVVGAHQTPVLKIKDLPEKEIRAYNQAKICLTKNDRFVGDAYTDSARARMQKIDRADQVQQIIKLNEMYLKLKQISANGMFAKLKYVGPEPSGLAVIEAKNFSVMLEGPINPTLLEETLSLHPQAVLEEGYVRNLRGQILWVKSGKAEHLKNAVTDVIEEMQSLGYQLRFAEHEVTDFANSAKVHFHFEKMDETGVFYNYTLYVDLTNIRLPYNPVDYEGNLTIGNALKKSEEVALYDYGTLAQLQTMILSTLTDILPLQEGSEAYERLVNTIL